MKRCKRCNRPLKSIESIQRGYGKVCLSRMLDEQTKIKQKTLDTWR